MDAQLLTWSVALKFFLGIPALEISRTGIIYAEFEECHFLRKSDSIPYLPYWLELNIFDAYIFFSFPPRCLSPRQKFYLHKWESRFSIREKIGRKKKKLYLFLLVRLEKKILHSEKIVVLFADLTLIQICKWEYKKLKRNKWEI